MCNLRIPFCSERQSTFITAGLSYFLIGAEYAIVIPTLNDYLRNMDDHSNSFMGYCLAAMSITSLLSAPIYGRITDITRTTKVVVLISNLFAIAGSFLYGISKDRYMLLGSRLIAGMTAGSAASIVSMISRGTERADRLSAMTKLFGSRQTGFMLGPAINLLLQKSDFHLFSFHVNSDTSPGKPTAQYKNSLFAVPEDSEATLRSSSQAATCFGNSYLSFTPKQEYPLRSLSQGHNEEMPNNGHRASNLSITNQAPLST